MARKKKGPSERELKWEKIWQDKRYVKLIAFKDRVAREWNIADAYKNTPSGSPAKAEKLSKAFHRANLRIYAYEKKAGL